MSNRSSFTNMVIAVLLLFSTSIAAAAELTGADWPQWRGPHRDCKVTESPKWPVNLDGLERLWRVEMGSSYSGPIVVGKRVFSTETVDKEKEVVRAFDRESGKELWKAEWTGSMTVPFFAARNGSWIRATPACDGETLFAAGMQDVLVALDVTDGKERWRVDFKKRYETGDPAFGFVCSPLIDGDFVYVQAGLSFVKLNKKSGETIWRTLVENDPMLGSAFSSPIIATVAGKRQIIVQTRDKLAGVDEKDGSVLWEQTVPSFRGMNILTPTIYNDGIFTSTHRNASYFYQVSKGDGNSFRIEEKWSDKAKGYMSSPVVIDHFAYLHLGNGRICCFDLRDGEEKWRSKSFGDYMSMATQGDRILGLDMRGGLVYFRANPEKFEILAKKRVSEEECWAHIAVSGDLIYIRELNGLSAWRWGSEKK